MNYGGCLICQYYFKEKSQKNHTYVKYLLLDLEEGYTSQSVQLHCWDTIH
jgi:hypothetical protein